MHIHELMAKMANLDTAFRSKHGHAPSQAKLAALVGIPLEKLQLLLKVSCLPSIACWGSEDVRKASSP